MKLVLWVAMILSCTMSYAQQPGSFKIEGQLKNVRAAKAYLVYFNGVKSVMDTAAVVNNSYTFSGVLPGKPIVTLAMGGPASENGRLRFAGSVRVFLSEGVIRITHTDSFPNIAVSGAADATLYAVYQQQVNPYQEQENGLMVQFLRVRQSGDASAQQDLQNRAASISKEAREKVLYPFVRSHPASPVSLHLLSAESAKNTDHATIKTLYEGLTPVLKNSSTGKELAAKLNN